MNHLTYFFVIITLHYQKLELYMNVELFFLFYFITDENFPYGYPKDMQL